MKRLVLAALAASAILVPARADDSIESLRQPAIDKCIAAGTGGDAAQSTTMCTCLVDGIIEKIPGEDGVKMLKLLIADPKSDEEAAAALGVPAEEAKAFVTAHQQTVAEVAASCTPTP